MHFYYFLLGVAEGDEGRRRLLLLRISLACKAIEAALQSSSAKFKPLMKQQEWIKNCTLNAIEAILDANAITKCNCWNRAEMLCGKLATRRRGERLQFAGVEYENRTGRTKRKASEGVIKAGN